MMKNTISVSPIKMGIVAKIRLTQYSHIGSSPVNLPVVTVLMPSKGSLLCYAVKLSQLIR
ncbi:MULTISPECIES: hypothetical protein [Providencia]|uniref:hypothetical protein n=1 Tax=Providencia TaxID=586 RepID=UPI0002EF5EDD|nr:MULTISPECIES: hypothetical protein [Providencia]EMF0917870.1 hypothetical protein [Providencia stuartii]MBN5560018.1 hypothetical protein [Providencia stuartii]MBN5600082.1 hypothetical protein [Providencia stuartii]MBN5603975.1 hypothetical protein [Providencia stuartii]MDK7737978.1 hypothetical protein [Providencia stuartii]